MTRFTQGDAITHFKAQLRILRELFDMMSIQVPSPVITTMLTGIVISLKYSATPLSVLSSSTKIKPSLCFSIDPRVMALTPYQIRRGSRPSTNLLSLRPCAGDTFSWTTKARLTTHILTSFFREMPSLHRRETTLRAFLFYYSLIYKTINSYLITTGSISPKCRTQLPTSTSSTPFLPSINMGEVLFKRNTDTLCINFSCSKLGLSHFAPPMNVCSNQMIIA